MNISRIRLYESPELGSMNISRIRLYEYLKYNRCQVELQLRNVNMCMQDIQLTVGYIINHVLG